MIGKMVSHYRILEKLGGGGMGVVYKAEDTKLHRFVALKFLPAVEPVPHAGPADAALKGGATVDRQALERFQREAQAASALNHPNICTIHDIDEYEGQPFIAMELLEGETLRHRIAKPLTPGPSPSGRGEAESLKGLPSPTGRGWPGGGGTGEGATDTPTASIDAAHLTSPGVAMGTVAYMSPEQARGEELDARTDLFSFGAVLYEMATGRQPFSGSSSAMIFTAVLRDSPALPSRRNPEIPPKLEEIILKGLEKDRKLRYQTAGDLRADLQRLKRDTDSGGSASVAPGFSPALSPTAALKGGATVRAGREPRRWRGTAVGLGALILAASLFAAWWYLVPGRGKAIDSIAVLPFVNAGADPNTEYLSDGITESIIGTLSQLSQLRVMGRSSAFRYKGKDVDPQMVGQELKVGAVLTGRITERGDSLVVRADLVRVSDGSELWGEQYNRKIADALAVQEEIAKEISDKLRLRLTGDDQQKLSRRTTADVEAYQLYLRGRYHWNRRTAGDMKKSAEYFEQAVEKDPSYALAYAGLADAYGLFADYSVATPPEALPRAKAAATKAVELDPKLAEGWSALAHVKALYDWDLPGAENDFKRALQLNPNYATAHYFYGLDVLLPLGRFEDAFREVKRAQELDPLSLSINANLAWPLQYARRYDEALEQARKALELDANFEPTHERMMAVFELKGMYAEAVAECPKIGLACSPAEQAALRKAYAAEGSKGYWKERLAMYAEKSNHLYVKPTEFARAYAMLGVRDKGFEWLEKGYKERDEDVVDLKDPAYDSLRSDPRYKDLLRRMGLPP